MSSRIKRLLSMLLALTMVFSLTAPVSVSAASTTAVSNNKVEIEVGETAKLKVSGGYSKTTWTSSDEETATVSSNGTVTGVAPGTATITAVSKSYFSFWGGTKTTTFTVIVTEPEETLTVKAGETLQLEIETTGGTVTWKSSDKKVATVDSNGLVTGVSEGDVTITATEKKTTGGNKWFFWWGGGKTTTTVTEFEVTVLPSDEKPTETEGTEPPVTEPPVTEPPVTEPPVTEPPVTEPPVTEPPVVTYTVTFESNGGSAVEAQIVEEGMTAAEPDEPVRAGFLFDGWYVDKELTTKYDFSAAVIADITLYANWLYNEEDTTDSDGDELPDWLEVMYGADPEVDDTDGDGLSDYDELMLTNTDPAIADTDENGISDADEDIDGDGLPHKTEVAQGTNPLRDDTDGDGLSDADEPAYGTDPLIEDTDGDGASDGVEVQLGTDPLSADVEFNVTVSSNVNDDVTPSVDITLSGDQIDSLEVEPSASGHLFPESMPGYLGMAYDFSVDGEFESATISFEFDASILENGADPAIFYFNEENQALEELETTIEGNVASAVVAHFSTYVLIDRTVYYSSLTWEDVWETDGTYDSVEVVLVIDDSGSLGGDYTYNSDTGYFEGGNDPEHLRLAAARNFVDKSSNAAKIGIVKFDSNVETFAGLTLCDDTGKDTLKNILQFTRKTSNTSGVFDSKGTTYMYTGIDAAFSLFTNAEETEDSILRVVIVFTDGNAHDASDHDSVVAAAINQNVRIYTVGLGSSTSYFNDYLKPLAEETGGSFYMTSDADQLASIYDDISKKIDLEADADGDGIPDYYEDHMIAFNGTKIELDKNDKDTDDDGLEDGEEVIVELVYNEDQTKVYVKGKLISYPDNEDSEGDGIPDAEDTAPLTKGLKDGIIGKLYLVTCYGDSFSDGHSFFAYESYVNDSIDFSGLVNGWHRKDASQSWTYSNLERDTSPTSEYAICPDEFVCIGNGALGGGPSSGASDGLSDGSTAGDANGVNYNMETAKFLSAGRPTGAGVAFSYLSNTYITEEITTETLEKLISYLSKESVNYWSLKHNCAHVAAEGWNHISDTEVSAYGLAGWHIFATPAALRDSLRKIAGHAEDWQMSDAFK